MASPPWNEPKPTATQASTYVGALNMFLSIAAAIWIVVLTIVFQVGAWFYDQIQLIDGIPAPSWFWIVIALVQALFAGIPALLLAIWGGGPPARAAGRAWCWAIGFGVL